MSGVLRAPRNPLRQGAHALHLELLTQFLVADVCRWRKYLYNPFHLLPKPLAKSVKIIAREGFMPYLRLTCNSLSMFSG